MNTSSTSPRLHLLPVSLRTANVFVLAHHHRPVQAAKFALAVTLVDSDLIRGVAIVGRPVARHLDDGWTREVTRLCTDSTPNACSKLYGAAWQAAKSLGYIRLITYTLPDEGGASLRAAGWRLIGARRRRLEPSQPPLADTPSTCAAPNACGRRRAARTKEAPGCRLIAAARARPGHADPMPADVVSDMPGNHRSSRLRRSSHCVTEPARTASIRERPPASGGGCFRLINPPRGYAPSPHAWAGVSPLHPNGDSP
jgi:hypothetical protein